MENKYKYPNACLFLLFLFLITSCISSPSTQQAAYVDLSNLQPLPTPVDDEIVPLRIAIAAVISPKGSAESYGPLFDYISEQLGRPVERVQRRTYAEVNELVESGEVDFAFVCTSSYIIGKSDFGMQLLVAPQVNGEAVYHAKIIVPAESTAETLEDLRGKVFAFTDPMSFSGRMHPTYLLQQMEETPETFFAQTFFTYSHDDAIYAVADGLAAGASVDSLVLDFILQRDTNIGSKIRVIHTSEPYGIPPVVVGPDIRPQLLAQLKEILLNAHLTPEGQAALEALDIDKFVIIGEEAFQSVEEILSLLNTCYTCEEE